MAGNMENPELNSAASQVQEAKNKPRLNAPTGYNWSDKWQANNFSSRDYSKVVGTPQRNRQEQAEDMKNWDKLTPYEQNLHNNVMPGIAKFWSEKVADTEVGRFVGESIKQADIDWDNGWAGKILKAFDYLHDMTWDTVGFLAQADKEDLDWYDKEELKDAYAAGSFLQEFANVPRRTYTNGEFSGYELTTEMPGVAGMVEARKEITRLRQGGMTREEAVEQVRYDTYEEYGALAMRMQMQDLTSRIFLDPLNVIQMFFKPADWANKTRIAILSTRFNKVAKLEGVLQDALGFAIRAGGSQVDEVGDVIKISKAGAEIVDTMADAHKAIDAGEAAFKVVDGGVELIDNGGNVQKAWRITEDGAEVFDAVKDLTTKVPEVEFKLVNYLTKAEQTGEVLGMWDKVSLFLTGGARGPMSLLDDVADADIFKMLGAVPGEKLPWYLDNTFERIANSKIPLARGVAKQFTLTEDAKAMEALGIYARHFGTHFAGMKTEEEIVDFMRKFANDIHMPKYAHVSTTVTGRISQKAAEASYEEILRMYRGYVGLSDEIGIVKRLSALLGIGEDTFLKNLFEDDLATMTKRLLDKGVDPNLVDEFSSPALQQNLSDIFKAADKDWIPLNFQQFKHKARLIAMEAGEELALKSFGVQDVGMWRKISEAIKAGETLAFLRLNPGFPVRNILNNTLTLLARRLSPFIPEDKIDDLIRILGETPWRMDEAYTWTGDTIARGGKIRDYIEGGLIRKKMMGDEKQFLNKVRNALNEQNLGIFDMGTLSQRAERHASKRAFYSGYKQGMRDEYWKVGKNFQPIRSSITASLSAKLSDEVLDTFDNIVADMGVSGKANFDDIITADMSYSWTDLVGEVEARTGSKLSGVFEEEFLAQFEDQLPVLLKQAREANDPDILRTFFREQREGYQKHLNELTDRRQELRIAYSYEITKGQGHAVIPTLVADNIDDLAFTQIGHNMRMMNLDPTGLTGEVRDILWRKVLAENEEYWGRHWKRMQDTYEGIKLGAGSIGVTLGDDWDDVILGYRSTWDDFFKNRNARYEGYFNTPKSKRTLTWEQMSLITDEAYKTAMKAEMEVLENIDLKLTAMIAQSDPALADNFATWRASVREMRRQIREKTYAFNNEVRGLDFVERNLRWKEFQQVNAEDWKRLSVAQREGMISMYGDTDVAAKLKEINPQAYNETIATAVARKFGVKGKVGDYVKNGEVKRGRLTNTVNKYLNGRYGDVGPIGRKHLDELGASVTAQTRRVSPERPTLVSSLDELKAEFGVHPKHAPEGTVPELDEFWVQRHAATIGEETLDMADRAAIINSRMAETQNILEAAADEPEIFLELINETDDPIGHALMAWQMNPEGTPFISKDTLIEAIRANPEQARKIQDFSQWHYFNEFGDKIDVFPTVDTYRAAKSGQELRPYDSVTMSEDLARTLAKGDDYDDLYKIVLPTENVFTGHDAHPLIPTGGDDLIGTAQEVILNEYGSMGAKVFKWDTALDDWVEQSVQPYPRVASADTLQRKWGFDWNDANVENIQNKLFGASKDGTPRMDLNDVNQKNFDITLASDDVYDKIEALAVSGKMSVRDAAKQVLKDRTVFSDDLEAFQAIYSMWLKAPNRFSKEAPGMAKRMVIDFFNDNPQFTSKMQEYTQWMLHTNPSYNVQDGYVTLTRALDYEVFENLVPFLDDGTPNPAYIKAVKDELEPWVALTDVPETLGAAMQRNKGRHHVQIEVPIENIMHTPDSSGLNLGHEREWWLNGMGTEGARVEGFEYIHHTPSTDPMGLADENRLLWDNPKDLLGNAVDRDATKLLFETPRRPVFDEVNAGVRVENFDGVNSLADIQDPELIAEAFLQRAIDRGEKVPAEWYTVKPKVSFDDLEIKSRDLKIWANGQDIDFVKRVTEAPEGMKVIYLPTDNPGQAKIWKEAGNTMAEGAQHRMTSLNGAQGFENVAIFHVPDDFAVHADDITSDMFHMMLQDEGNGLRTDMAYEMMLNNLEMHPNQFAKANMSPWMNAEHIRLRNRYAIEISGQGEKVIDLKKVLDIDAYKARFDNSFNPKYDMVQGDLKKLMGAGGPANDAPADAVYGMSGGAALDEMETGMMGRYANPEIKAHDVLDQEGMDELNNWMNTIKSDHTVAQIAGKEYAEYRRDAALLNYRRRYHFDNTLGLAMPYEFWMSHSMINWAVHSIDNASYMTTALRLKEMMSTVGVPREGMPSRLRGTVRMPFFNPPDWLGDDYFVNPIQWAMPIDQMLYPFEKVAGRKEGDVRSAGNILRQMVQGGIITEQQMELAITEQSGDIWERAMAQAKQSENRDDNFDIMSTFSSVHAPITWGVKAITGQMEDIGPLAPLGRTAKKMWGLFGVNPVEDKTGFGSIYWTASSSIRESLGMHPFDKWEDYRIDRAISNMVAEGDISVDEGMRAMLDREQNPFFQEAAKRAAEQYARGSVRGGTVKQKASSVLMSALNNVGLPVYMYPEGEDILRQLQEDFSRAYDAQEEDGDEFALREFFDENPEYEVKLAIWKEPGERMQNFLVGEIWDRWYELPKANKDIAADAFGEMFQNGFLDKETRNYDAINPKTMAIWLKMMGGSPPGSMDMEVIPLKFAPEDIAFRAEAFYEMRRGMFPDYYDQQQMYFKLSKEARKQYMQDNTALGSYWEWRNDYFHRNPEILPYVNDDYELEYESAQAYQEAVAGQPALSKQEWTWTIGGANVRLAERLWNGENLPTDIRNILSAEAKKLGLTLDELLQKISVAP